MSTLSYSLFAGPDFPNSRVAPMMSLLNLAYPDFLSAHLELTPHTFAASGKEGVLLKKSSGCNQYYEDKSIINIKSFRLERF